MEPFEFSLPLARHQNGGWKLATVTLATARESGRGCMLQYVLKVWYVCDGGFSSVTDFSDCVLFQRLQKGRRTSS